jgi:inward rectifier potassium channel
VRQCRFRGRLPRVRSLFRFRIGNRHFIRVGLERRPWQDLYHLCMTIGWPALFAGFAAFFVLFNLAFAGLYSLDPPGIANLDPHGYWGRFFFSIETLATVGYGEMHPQTPVTHSIVSLEIFVGLASVAVATGIIFSRFSRPQARFLFARYAVIRPFDGRLALLLRAANARQNIVMEARAQLRLLRDERTVEGDHIRRIYDLPLRRREQPLFLFGWTIIHDIDAASPFAGETPETYGRANALLLLTLTGTDETTGQVLMARQEYPATELRWNYSFVDILTTGEDGTDRFDYSKFHDVKPLA